MARLVQKFGGTSVADVNKIRKAAEIVVKAAAEGHEVTTVVSAMGHTTDHLISLAEQITPTVGDRNPREMDMLLATGEQVTIALMTMAIQTLGYEAKSFTGAQAGIITEGRHGVAKIQEM
jgi:aspartate kinase